MMVLLLSRERQALANWDHIVDIRIHSETGVEKVYPIAKEKIRSMDELTVVRRTRFRNIKAQLSAEALAAARLRKARMTPVGLKQAIVDAIPPHV